MNKINWKYVKRLQSEATVSEFEKAVGVVFPEDLRFAILNFNGGRPSLKYYDTNGQNDREFKTLLSFNENDSETIHRHYPLDSVDKTLIPFASDPAGNYFVLKNGRIGLWDHESDNVQIIAASFSEFLEMLHD